MSELRKIIGAKEFKRRVINKLKAIDESIKEDDLYFSQTATGYYMDYKPKYPESSNGNDNWQRFLHKNGKDRR